jgi:hypothetical protein
MKVILYTNDDGWVSVVTPAYPPGTTPAQEDQIAAWVQQKDVPPLPDGSPRPSVVKETSTLGGMKYFFEAWRLDTKGQVTWNRAAAHAMKKNQLRALRKPFLEKLDVEFMRAFERGDTAMIADIARRKQVLRDITLIDLSSYDTPETLATFVPEELKETTP